MQSQEIRNMRRELIKRRPHLPEKARRFASKMPDGTWLCNNCYSDCDKTAYGMVPCDVDDFEFPSFEDLPRPAPYALAAQPPAAPAHRSCHDHPMRRCTPDDCCQPPNSSAGTSGQEG